MEEKAIFLSSDQQTIDLMKNFFDTQGLPVLVAAPASQDIAYLAADRQIDIIIYDAAADANDDVCAVVLSTIRDQIKNARVITWGVPCAHATDAHWLQQSNKHFSKESPKVIDTLHEIKAVLQQWIND